LNTLNIGVIGYGYWGPNVVRNFDAIEGAKVHSVCDGNREAVKRARKTYPHIRATSDCNDIINSPEVDAVAVITPASTHYELAKRSLQSGKHVFVEKPFTVSSPQAEELIELAAKKNLKIMVDHTFIFTGAVRKIRECIDNGTLGDLYYYDSTRVNLGLFHNDVNVVWDLASHDFSIMDYLIKERPCALASCGKAHVNGMEDTAYITFYFSNNMIAHFNVNWLSPVKVRTTLIGGENKMIVWNDIDPDEKIKVYDKGVAVKNKKGVYHLRVSYRAGDMWAPRVEQIEALRVESEYFVDCVRNDKTPVNDGCAGLRIVKLLEACDESMRNNGHMVKL
jgi:predicted dehydrogenase